MRFLPLITMVALLWSCNQSTTATDKADDTKPQTIVSDTTAQQARNTHTKIAYIHKDSILANYEMVLDLNGQLELEQSQAERRLQDELKKFEKQYRDAEASLKNNPSQFQYETLQKQLAQKEQELAQMEQDLTRKFARKEAALNLEMRQSIESYLQEFCAEQNIDYVMGYSLSSDLFYTNPALDITNQVIEGLNNSYAKNKEGDK